MHNIIGTIGVSLIVGTYLALQLKKVSSDALVYSILNALGAALILTSLAVDFNFSAFLIEGFWLLISLLGVFLYFRRKKKNTDR